jgi:cytochrome c-type biogenesis protein CcmH/NrfF
MRSLKRGSRRGVQFGLLAVAVFTFLGADEARFENLGHQLMCVCGCNQVLLECNHVGCTRSNGMREELAANLGRGDNDDLVLQDFVQKYGPTVLLAPTAVGFDRVAWIMPYLVLVLGLTTVVLVVRVWRRRPLVLPEDSVAPLSGAAMDRFRQQARKDTDL